MEHNFCPYCMSPVEQGKPCQACGLTQGSYTPSPHHLPPGTVLKERYLVGRVLGEGGFGITYIGCDLQLELKVAIKEYFPTDKASRMAQASLDVVSYTGAAGIHFATGLKKFLREARTIARMDKQPVIVNVRDFFETNHTAYIVMEYVEGTTFKDLVDQRGGRIPAGELLYLIEPLFFALKEMHANGLIHRDISPENLMLEKGEVRLLDFGCARESAGGETTMTIALKHGYAPVEQYQSKGQGPWTDVYALSATIYYCLTGRKPPQAMDRLLEDELTPPRRLGVELSQQQEKALLHGMAVPPNRRFQSMEEFHTALYEGFDPTPAPIPPAPTQPDPAPGPIPSDPTPAPNPLLLWLKQNRLLAGGVAAALALVILAAAVLPRLLGPAAQPEPSPTPDASASADPAPESSPPASSTVDGPVDDGEGDPALTQLLNALKDDATGTVVVAEGANVVVEEPITLTKTLRLNAESAVSFTKGLTVAGGGRVEVSGNLEAPVLLRTMDGGTIAVEDGGNLNTPMIWLEREGDLTCTADGRVDLWGGLDPTKGPIEDYNRSHYHVFSEEELFAGAVHVGSEEEFSRYYEGNTPIVIDRDITFDHPYRANAPILIPEGVTVDAPAPMWEEGNALHMAPGSILVNRGTITGRLELHGFTENGSDPYLFVNYGAVDASLLTEVGTIVNLGDMVTREILQQTALSNLGSLTFDGQMEMLGNHSFNAGSLTVAGDADLAIYGGTWWQNFSQFTVEDGGRVRNYAQFCNNSGTLLVRAGGAVDNFGLLTASCPSVFHAETGSGIVNHGVIEYAEGSLELAENTLEGGGHTIPYASASDWGAMGERVRFVEAESDLREALADERCDLVIWNGFQDHNKISLNGGPLTVSKGLVLQADNAHMVDVNTGDITLSGENAFLVGQCVDFHGNGLTAENGATAVLDNDSRAVGRLTVSEGAIVFIPGSMASSGGAVEIRGGGQLINTSSLRLDGCSLRTDGDGCLYNYGGDMRLTDCDVVNDGSFQSFFGWLLQEGGSFVNNGRAEFTGWHHMAILNGDVSNHGELVVGGRQEIGGALVNEQDGSMVLDWEDCPLQVSGRLENKGRIWGRKGAYVETVGGGVFTGNPVVYD